MKSQGLVEFALILPVLVLIVFGLIETGRLIFTYSSAVSASREATRYASATGTSPRGVPYYQDCRGIRDAAKRMAFINPLEDAQITIQYDNGPGTTPTPYCEPGNDVDVNFIPQPGSRVLVRVEMNFLPLVPGLLPYPSFTITAPNARTILVPVSVEMPSGGGSSPSPLTLTKSANPSRFFKAGQTIQYTYTVRNNTTGTLRYIYVSDDRVSNVTCASTTLAPSASTTCTATYTTTDRDVNNRAITNTAVATGRRSDGVVVYSNQAQLTIPFVRAELSLTKQANPTIGAVGTVITYSYTLKNTGDVELYAPYAVTDNKVSGITCPNTPSPLPTGQSITCTKTYTISSADANAKEVINVATATATLDGQTVTSNQAQARVLVGNLDLQVTANPSVVAQADTSVTFTYTVINIGSSTLTGLSITDTLVPGISCGTTTLNAGQSTTCTGTYTVTQDQLDNGAPLTSQATASGMSGSSSVSSPTVTTTITLQRLPALSLQISATPNPVTPDPVTNPPDDGETVTYTYTLQNTGNVTLQSPYAVTDDKITNINCSSATSPLPPGQSTTCTKSYTITDADVQNGSIISTATAKAKDTNGNEIVSNPASYTLIVWNAPRLSISLNASPGSITKGGTVSLIFTVKNTGNQDLSNVTVSYNVNNTPQATIPCTTMLKIGQSFRCFASYTVPSNYGARTITFQAQAAAQSPNVESTPTAPLEVTVVDCNVTILSLTSNNNEIQMRINNGQTQPVSINRLQIAWNNPNTLTQISLDTTVLWRGSPSTSPFNLTPSNATIPSSQEATLKFTFQNSYIGSPLDSIVVDFGSGCILVGRWP